jgi:hypothetical protein
MKGTAPSICHVCQQPATQRSQRCYCHCCPRHWQPWSGFQPLEHFRVCQECREALTSAQTPRDMLAILEQNIAERGRQYSPNSGKTHPLPMSPPPLERTYQTMTELTVHPLLLGSAAIAPPSFQMHTTVPYHVRYPAGTVWFESQAPSQPGYLVRMPHEVFVREVCSPSVGLRLTWGVTPQEQRQVAHAPPVQPR